MRLFLIYLKDNLMAAATQNTDETLVSTDEKATTKSKTHVIKPIKLQKHRIPKLVMKKLQTKVIC